MQWELELIKIIQSIQNGFFDMFFWIISLFASFLGAFLLFIFFLFFANKKFAIYYALCTTINVCFNYILKFFFNRPRPFEIDANIINKAEALGQSFPSGHMICATTMIIFLIIFILQKCKKKWTKIFLVALCILFLIFVAISRMYLGQHYFTDILSGILLSIILTISLANLVKKQLII